MKIKELKFVVRTRQGTWYHQRFISQEDFGKLENLLKALPTSFDYEEDVKFECTIKCVINRKTKDQ